MQCPICGKFLSNVVASVNQWTERITKVEGICKIHGTVQPEDWEADDFVDEKREK